LQAAAHELLLVPNAESAPQPLSTT